MFGEWQLPTSYCMVTAVGKGIDRAQVKSEVRPKVRKPLSWDLLTKRRRSVAEMETDGDRRVGNLEQFRVVVLPIVQSLGDLGV